MADFLDLILDALNVPPDGDQICRDESPDWQAFLDWVRSKMREMKAEDLASADQERSWATQKPQVLVKYLRLPLVNS